MRIMLTPPAYEHPGHTAGFHTTNSANVAPKDGWPDLITTSDTRGTEWFLAYTANVAPKDGWHDLIITSDTRGTEWFLAYTANVVPKDGLSDLITTSDTRNTQRV